MRLRCKCGSELFYLQYPPEHTEASQKIVYIICNSCQGLVGIKLRNLELDVDKGVIQGIKKIYGQETSK